MAEERGYYQLEEQPAFKEQVERLLNSDEVRAEGSQFESLLLSMLNNIKAAYQKAGSVADGVGKPGGAASLDETGKVPANQIPDLSGQYETLRPMSLLESGTDLNTLTTPGTYGTAGSSVTASLINAPETTGYMSMTVRRAYSNAMLVQEYFIWTSSTTFSLYYRTKWNSSSDWAQWQQVYTSGDKPTAADVGADPAGSAAAVQANLTAHEGDAVKHVTAEERTAWNGKANAADLTSHINNKSNPHGVTAGQTGALPLSGGTMTGSLKAMSSPAVGTAQARNIYAGTSDMTAGSSTLATGTIYLVYE